MCDGCDKPGERAEPAEQSAKGAGALSRRTVLLAGAGVAAGFIGGLWSCQNTRIGGGKIGGASAASASSGPAPVPGGNADALPHGMQEPQAGDRDEAIASAQAGQSGAAEGGAAEPGETPDLGAAVFSDARGIAIARPGDAPVIMVPRTDWTLARPNLKQIVPMNGISRLTVHHTAGEIQTDAWKPTAGELEAIREFHSGTQAKDRHWADIAYHFAVDRAGRVWQARPLAYQGAHVRGQNEHNLGIVLLGNFEVQTPAAAQLTALSLFIGFVRGLYKIPLGQVFTHGELGMTSCPGKTLQAYMDRAREQWAAAEGVAWQAMAAGGKGKDSDEKPR